jgi:hypothetical protein
MADLGIFGNDKFSLESLTAAINVAPSVPGMIGGMGLFDEEGISTTRLDIEKNTDTLVLIPNTNRGGDGTATLNPTLGGTRNLVPFTTTHLPTRSDILADEVQNIRAFGTSSELDTTVSVVNTRLAKMRSRLDATIEYQRIGAIKGVVLDANGSTVISNLFTAFGIAQLTQSFAAGGVALNAKTAVRKSEDHLGDAIASGYAALCGRGFFDFLEDDADFKDAAKAQYAGQMLLNDNRTMQGINYKGVKWLEFKGGLSGTPWVADGEAYLVPLGVMDLFKTVFAPGDYIDVANTTGLPYYAMQEFLPMKKGVRVEAQSSPLSICTRPASVIKLTLSA